MPRSARGPGPGQAAEIDRVLKEHADLGDDAFVAARQLQALASACVGAPGLGSRALIRSAKHGGSSVIETRHTCQH